jgi:hypothetical protein
MGVSGGGRRKRRGCGVCFGGVLGLGSLKIVVWMVLTWMDGLGWWVPGRGLTGTGRETTLESGPVVVWWLACVVVFKLGFLV